MVCGAVTRWRSANASVDAEGVAEPCVLTDSCLAQGIGEGNIFLQEPEVAPMRYCPLESLSGSWCRAVQVNNSLFKSNRRSRLLKSFARNCITVSKTGFG